MDRYLVYQPNHGMAVEVHLLESAMQIATALDRILVLPRLPVLETTQYERSIDHYFSMPTGFPWISTDRLFATIEPRIATLFQVIPHYAKEYRCQITRRLHPVWLDNIEHYPYFGLVGYDVASVLRVDVHRPLGLEGVRELFGSPHRVIGVTHINGLLAEGIAARHDRADDHFVNHAAAPEEPRARFLRPAEQFVGDKALTALHWRRGRVLVEMAKRVLKIRLPELEDLYRRVQETHHCLFLATDADESLVHPPPRPMTVHRFTCDSPNERATMDLAICSLAEYFIGTEASTFSHLISHLRRRRGHPIGSTLLL